MPFACPFALCQWRCKPSVSLAHSQADEDDASVDGRYPGAGLIYVYVQVESERVRERGREIESERAKYLVQVQCVPYCCNVKLSAHSMTHAALTHTHRFTLTQAVSSLVLSRTSPVSFTHAHTMQAAANSPERICCCCFELDEEEEEEDEQTSKSKSRRHKSNYNYNYSGGCPVYRCCCCCCFPYYRTLCSFCGALQNVAVAPLSLLAAASSSTSLFGF